jgi:hypothetical protein
MEAALTSIHAIVMKIGLVQIVKFHPVKMIVMIMVYAFIIIYVNAIMVMVVSFVMNLHVVQLIVAQTMALVQILIFVLVIKIGMV